MAEIVGDIVGGGQGRDSRRHCMPPMTFSSGLSMAGADESIPSLRESSFRLPGRGVSGHKAHRAREDGVESATESL